MMNLNCVIFEKRIECSKTCFSNSHFGASRAGKHKIQAEPHMAPKPALDVGANLCVRPKILQYFFILPTIRPK
jgi:hypothetical protein